MFETERVTVDQYKSLVPDRRVFFNEPDFTELNRDKADDIHYLIIKKENSPRFALILGVRGDVASSPFSAPYAYPVPIGPSARVEAFDEAMAALLAYCEQCGFSELHLRFPPFRYDEDVLSAWASAMYRQGFALEDLDINYMLDLKALNTDDYQGIITRKGRSHLRRAIEAGIRIVECADDGELEEAYNVILENHSAKGRPTHMTLDQLKATFALVNHAVFLARLGDKGIAAMIYYEITPEIVQCIYSGYLLDYSNSGVMNYLTWYAIRYYGDKGFRFIDRAIATENSIPNYGLCDFKESVGGKRSLKYTFVKKFGKG